MYGYRAARPDGGLELGVIEANSRDSARTLLSHRGLFPLELRLDESAEVHRQRMPARDVALGLRMLATLLESGLPMSRALLALEDLVPVSWKPHLPPLRQAVREGRGLAMAMTQATLPVPPLVTGIMEAGEAGSGIAAAVRRAAELMEGTAATHAAVWNALAYPLLLAIASAASLSLLVGFVLPRFAAILTDLGQSLPATTRLVLGAGALLRRSALPGILTLGLAALAWRAWTARPEGREKWHGTLLAAPVVGPLRLSLGSSRICAALSALLESGVPLGRALVHASRAAGDAALQKRLLAAREKILEGHGAAAAIGAERALTTTAVRLVHTGEETGRLAAMLSHAARLESERGELMVRALVRVVEPALIVTFGGIVALVAAGLLQAVYSVRPTP